MESSKPRTIRGKILMIFILTVIPFMMISALISTYSIETSNERVKASYTTLLEMLKRDIDNDLAIIDSNMRLQFTTNDTLFMQFANATNQSDSAFFRTNLYNELQNSTRSISALYSYFVFSPVYYPKIPLLVYSGVKTIEETQKMKEAIMDVVQEPQWMELSNGAWFMFSIGDKAFIAKIYQFNNAYIGALIDSQYFLGRVEYASLDCKMVIADDVPSTNKNIVIRELSMFKNCYLCLTMGQTNGFAQLPCVLKLMISVLIIVSMGAILLLMHLARDILNPFRELTDNVELISKGDLSIRLPENNRYYEFSLLHRRFNSMMNEICDLKIQNYENEIKLKSLALQCRQLEINPHFFIGALNTVYTLVSYKRYSVVPELLTEMISYMRSVLTDHGNKITLKEELGRIKSFLHVQQLRFDRVVDCSIHVSPELLGVLVPPMILLTFVENAIKHNSLDHQSLLITINVRQTEGKMILITVSDNGRGFSSTAIEQINRGEKIYYEEVAHIGIYNVFARLPLLYGNDSWAYVENNEKGGACIKISIPKEMKGIE